MINSGKGHQSDVQLVKRSYFGTRSSQSKEFGETSLPYTKELKSLKIRMVIEMEILGVTCL
jgi:hypothetical protein